jgi:hypothetical protein
MSNYLAQPPKARLEDLVGVMGTGPCKAFAAEIRRHSASFLEARDVDPESLLILNLALRDAGLPEGHDASSWLFIGDDGVGNLFFVDAVNDPTGVKLLSHDPPGIENPGITLREFIAAAEIQQSSGNYDGEGLVICRADDPRRAILNPIRLEDWKTVAEMHSCIEFLGYRRGANPFTGEALTFRAKGGAYIGWQGTKIFVHLWSGGLHFDNQSEDFMPFASALAQQLRANLFPGRS